MEVHTVSEEARSAIEGRRWFHSFEVLPGLWTPGRSSRIDTRHVLSDLHGLPQDMTGMRALDIGTLDGPYAFELEKRGADAVGLDIQSPDRMGFNTAKKVRNSKVQHVQGNVYDLSTLFPSESFDIVLFFGVWYHLKNPVRAFEQINLVLKTGGTLAAEGECLLNYMEFNDSALQVDTLSKSDIPLSIFYPNGVKNDVSSWYVPNPACVKAWTEATSFNVIQTTFEDHPPHQRMRISAIKSGSVRVDNPVW